MSAGSHLGQRPEPAYRALMLAYSEVGDRSKVVSTFQRCVQTLRDDLGVEPSELTRGLYEQLTAGSRPVVTVPSAVPRPASTRAEPAAPGQDARSRRKCGAAFQRSAIL